MKTKEIKTKSFSWLHISKPGRKEIEYLKDKYNFHPLDLEDCLVKIQRPQISEYTNHIFFILTFPVYNRVNKEIESSEIDFFISAKYIITISDEFIPVVNNLFEETKDNNYNKEKYMSPHPVYLLYETLHRLQNYTFPMLDHISEDIEAIEKKIFSGKEKEVVSEILNVKRNILHFRKIMQAHKNIIKKLMNTHTKFFMPDKTNVYLSNILDRTKDIWDILETQKENMNAFQETNDALISHKLNEIMRILTVISVILIPANLVASTFGMNTKFPPFIGNPYDFYKIVSLMFIILIIVIIYFKRKRWF